MRIICIVGSHPRHLFFMNTIREKHEIAGAIIQLREDLVPLPPDDIGELDKQNFIRHFKNRKDAEKRYFRNQTYPSCPVLEIKPERLNSAETVEFVKKTKPDTAFIFGTGLIKEPLCSALPYNTLNLHLGISPRYRGAATLFWPFYFLEPPYAGSTFHYILGEPDAGDIVHQVVPDLDINDRIHDVACKTIIASAHDALTLIEILRDKGKWKTRKQRGTGKNFLASDFKPEHLRVIYNQFNDDMVKHYLEGRLKSKKPNLARQF